MIISNTKESGKKPHISTFTHNMGDDDMSPSRLLKFHLSYLVKDG